MPIEHASVHPQREFARWCGTDRGTALSANIRLRKTGKDLGLQERRKEFTGSTEMVKPLNQDISGHTLQVGTPGTCTSDFSFRLGGCSTAVSFIEQISVLRLLSPSYPESKARLRAERPLPGQLCQSAEVPAPGLVSSISHYLVTGVPSGVWNRVLTKQRQLKYQRTTAGKFLLSLEQLPRGPGDALECLPLHERLTLRSCLIRLPLLEQPQRLVRNAVELFLTPPPFLDRIT